MCSVIALNRNGQAYLGANYDFRYGHGLVYVTTRGVKKWTESNDKQRYEWKSIFGSVSLVQFGCELPTCGMNEAGLAIHLLEQRDAVYPNLDNKKMRLNELQWIQYHLDTCESVEDVVNKLSSVQVEKNFINLHYALCDAHGDLAFIEHVNGETIVIREKNQGAMALTNHCHTDSENNYQHQLKTGRAPPLNAGSFNRYYHLRKQVDKFSLDDDPKNFLWNALIGVAIRPGITDYMGKYIFQRPMFLSYWHTLFCPSTRTMWFASRENAKTCFLDLSSLDFSETGKRLLSDMGIEWQGNFASALQPYSKDLNAAIIKKTYRPYKKFIPDSAIQFLIDYPEMLDTH